MAKPSPDIKVIIKQKDIRASLLKLVRSEHSVLIVDTIIGYLANNSPGLEHLFLALSGMQKKLEFKPLDEVFINIERLSTWRVDKDKTRAAGMTTKDHIRATVDEINPYTIYRVKVTYTYKDSSDDSNTINEWVSEDDLHSAEDPFLEDLQESPDLPF